MPSRSISSLAPAALERARNDRRTLLTQLDHRTLDNGARVYVLPTGEHGIAAFEVWASIGAGDEPAELAGISHLLEHMMFRGTHDAPDGEFDIRVQALGARANAWTWYDTTAYTTILSAEFLPTLIALEADRFENLHISERVFQSECDVVLNERSLMADSDPSTLAHEHFDRLLFGEGPYARPVLGYRENIAALTSEDLTRWYKQHYAPHALDIFVVGDVDVSQVYAQIEEHFGSIPAYPSPLAARPGRTAHRAGHHEEITLPVAEPLILMGWGMPEGSDRRAVAAWKLLSEFLAFGRGGVLRSALEHEKRLALYQDFYLQEHRLGHSALWEATPREGVSCASLVNDFYALMQRLAENGPRIEDLDAARIRILSNLASRNAPWQLLQQLGDALHTSGRLDAFVDDLDALQNVSVDDIRALAKQLADKDSNILLFVRPETS